MDIVAPEELTMEQLSKTNVNLRDILRDAFKFCLRGGDERLKQALVIAKRMAKTFEAWESQVCAHHRSIDTWSGTSVKNQ